jgi:hypothetical protein
MMSSEVVVATSAEKILDELRALQPSERLRVVEQIVRETAAQVGSPAGRPAGPIWNDESDADFDAFQNAVQRLRSTDVWRIGNGSNAR